MNRIFSKSRLSLYYLLILLTAACSPARHWVTDPEAAGLYETDHLVLFRTPDRLILMLDNEQTSPALTLSLKEGFLEARTVDTDARFDKGSFHFKDRVRDRCRDLQIEEFSTTDHAVLLTARLCGQYNLRLRFSATDSLTLEVEAELLGEHPFDQLILHCASDKNERFFGLGAQYSEYDLKGHRVPLWVEEQGIGRGDQPITFFSNFYGAGGDHFSTSAPIPFLLSTRRRSFELGGGSRMAIDLRKKDEIRLEVFDSQLRFKVRQAGLPADLVAAHTREAGRGTPLPDWVFGTILGIQGGQERVLGKIDSLEAAGCPIDAIWIQDWVGQRQTSFGSQLWWYWEPDSSRYGDLSQFCEDLAGRGIAALGYLNPFLVDHGPLFDEARERGYFVKRDDGSDYPIEATGFSCFLIDLTNPEAFTWFKAIIRTHLIDNGFSGWMADFGEWLPTDARLFSGIDAARYHNRYAVDWARLNYEAIQEAGKEGEIAFFTRAAFSGSGHYAPFYWLGDQLVSWGRHDGIGSVVPALLSSGSSGMAVNHSDVGGFTTIKRFPVSITRSRELLQRWIELGAFSPVFRTHEGLRPDLNRQVYDEPDMRAFYSKFSQVREELRPYLLSSFEAFRQKGEPLVRSMYYSFPSDPETLKIDQQYMLGPDLLVAPVVRKGKQKVRMYLPAGEWEHFWSGERFAGGRWLWVKAPLGEPAVFWRR